jgi:hypothetical protein
MYSTFTNNYNQNFSSNNTQFNHIYELNKSIDNIPINKQPNKKILNSTPSRQRVKSSYLKKTPIKQIKRINYQKKYETIKNNIDKIKGDIVQERMKGTLLSKEFNKVSKKEKMYDDVFKENNYILKENEILEKKILESEEIRKQQNLVINSLKREFNELIRICNQEDFKNNFNLQNEIDNIKNMNNKKKNKSKKKIIKVIIIYFKKKIII